MCSFLASHFDWDWAQAGYAEPSSDLASNRLASGSRFQHNISFTPPEEKIDDERGEVLLVAFLASPLSALFSLSETH